MKKLIKSFGYAFSGLWACIIYERNFRIHISAALAVFVFAWLYGVDNVHLAVLVLTVALVFITEAVNTSIEKAVDFLSPERFGNCQNRQRRGGWSCSAFGNSGGGCCGDVI